MDLPLNKVQRPSEQVLQTLNNNSEVDQHRKVKHYLLVLVQNNVKITYGNITFVNRNKLSLEKSHVNDAFVIASGTTQSRSSIWNITQKRRNNRALQLNRKEHRRYK